MSDNYYGWFERVRTGIYDLNPKAMEELSPNDAASFQ